MAMMIYLMSKWRLKLNFLLVYFHDAIRQEIRGRCVLKMHILGHKNHKEKRYEKKSSAHGIIKDKTFSFVHFIYSLLIIDPSRLLLSLCVLILEKKRRSCWYRRSYLCPMKAYFTLFSDSLLYPLSLCDLKCRSGVLGVFIGKKFTTWVF